MKVVIGAKVIDKIYKTLPKELVDAPEDLEIEVVHTKDTSEIGYTQFKIKFSELAGEGEQVDDMVFLLKKEEADFLLR